ncbi:Hypothetical predicted protein [Pelobates cultripes]|uniref:Uncharacterized protein n=1 Tax=Pelobates cultripes TaxID=61616 RepID=A0AAD1VLU4_PELCU|nr:Hypothetical predicted protein [Pelobates cultripes]
MFRRVAITYAPHDDVTLTDFRRTDALPGVPYHFLAISLLVARTMGSSRHSTTILGPVTSSRSGPPPASHHPGGLQLYHATGPDILQTILGEQRDRGLHLLALRPPMVVSSAAAGSPDAILPQPIPEHSRDR